MPIPSLRPKPFDRLLLTEDQGERVGQVVRLTGDLVFYKPEGRSGPERSIPVRSLRHAPELKQNSPDPLHSPEHTQTWVGDVPRNEGKHDYHVRFYHESYGWFEANTAATSKALALRNCMMQLAEAKNVTIQSLGPYAHLLNDARRVQITET